MKSLYGAAKLEKKQKDYLTEKGRSEGGALREGVRLLKPLDSYGKELPTGYNYTLPEGDVTVYDGIVRYIDTEVFNHDVAIYEKRQKQVDKLVTAFLKTGDAVCFKYIGHYYNWLQEKKPTGNELAQLISYVMMDGLDGDKAEAYVKKYIQYDGTPDHINSFTNPSPEYTNCLNKLMMILKYCCVVFVGKEPIALPYAQPGVDEGFHTPDASQTSINERNSNRLNLFGNLGQSQQSALVSGSGSSATPPPQSSTQSKKG